MPAVNEEPVETAPVPAPAPEIAEDVFSEAIAAAMTMPESDVRELPDDIELLDGGGSASDAFVSNALSGAPAEPVDPEPQVFVNHHQEVKKMEQQVVQQLSAPTDENAVITAGMRIDGDVTTSGSLDVIGKINGNVTANGKLSVTGSLEGNLNAAEIYAENARITGEVRSQGAAKIGQSTVIIGNIYATSAVIAGAVKGDIDVHGPVVLDTTAIVMGNIKSQSVQINNGAVVEGMCSQSYAEVNPQAFFDGLDD
ncbi:MAG: polymer-forming cytoskeletal protein [Lachnospiraceae bacterium]|nr:polymer-forming cytoskeletal protein [Lachnospiraceae bacterium]